jgi:hypothetical protein
MQLVRKSEILFAFFVLERGIFELFRTRMKLSNSGDGSGGTSWPWLCSFLSFISFLLPARNWPRLLRASETEAREVWLPDAAASAKPHRPTTKGTTVRSEKHMILLLKLTVEENSKQLKIRSRRRSKLAACGRSNPTSFALPILRGKQPSPLACRYA